MSDSFADLWNSTAPTKPSNPPRTLGSIAPSGAYQQRKPTNDVFSLLAATSSSSSSRSVSPSYATAQQKTSGHGAVPTVKAIQKTSSTSDDAFSDLFSTNSASASNSANMTIAERAALAEKQRLGQLRQTHSQKLTDHTPGAWAGLDSLGTSSLIGGTNNVPSKASQRPEDDWTFTFNQPEQASAVPIVRTSSPPADDDWGLDDFVSKPASTNAARLQSQTSQSLWDLDEFDSHQAHTSRPRRASPAPINNGTSTPGSFDFGDREDGLLNEHSDDEDDILGDLAKPAGLRPSSSNGNAHPAPSPPLTTSQRSRAVSPPPHILGQIVEMGFSVQQARVALAATDTGLDVQVALETLLSNGVASGSGSPPGEARSRDRPRPRYDDPEGQHRDESSHPHQRIHPQRDHQRETPSRENPNSAAEARQLQEHADKLIAQASEIGLSVFNRANALWNVGKEKVQRAYEERAAASISSTPKNESKPKWMQETTMKDGEPYDEGWGGHVNDGFKDDHDESEVFPPRPEAQRQAKAPEVRAKPQPHEPSNRVKTGNLLSDDAPTVYVSPFRRKVPVRSQVATHESAPTPTPLIQRKTISAPASALAMSSKHKAAGTEMFKLGRYAEAETSYSYAIAALPDSHLLLVPLYNNRALARIKTGDHNGAIEDCTTVIALIGPSYHPAREVKVTKEDEGSSVDLADAFVKALRRRAEAYEGKEKWDDARKDWETIAGAEWAGRSRGEAASAAGRCRRMLTANVVEPASSKAQAVPQKSRPRPKPANRSPTPPSEALNRVREANEAAEAEDQEKHALKDTVDGKLTTWKGGKETNIRALIASLDTVLWPELGWQKVGMHELVTPSQVKIRYTKAIAKLHPDKLNVNNTTLEQRMIANGVFGSLNDAWNAFKQ